VEGLTWETIQLPFAAGLNTKAHDQALEPPGLTTCKNVEFDEVGALRLRKPYASIGTSIHPSGTIADARKLAVVGDELLLFTKDTLYSWSEALTKWVSKGTHLAAKVDEATRFSNTSDQVAADRAQLSNLIVYTWMEIQPAGAAASYLAAIDAVTGATVIDPTSFGANHTRPSVVAVDTKILVFWIDTVNGVECTSIDPASPSFTTAGATSVSADIQAFDVMRDPAADRAVLVVRNAAGTAYTVARITAALAVTTSAKARTADGVIALSVAPSGTDRVQILRSNGTNVRGDLLVVSTLADVFADTAVGTAATTINQLTGAHRSTTDGGFYRCYAFWSAGETSGGASFELKSNYADTNNGTGTQAVFLLRQGVAARAFNHDGRVYLWSAFAGASGTNGAAAALGLRAQQQNAYHLHRDDGFLVAKALWTKAGGFGHSSDYGHLPNVALVSGTTGYAWCGIERQIITLGGTEHSGYSARAPRDVVFTFDSDEARRVVQLGRTAYVSGGMLLQYDGEGLVEVGFEQYPWFIDANATNTGGMAAGTYSYKSTLRWDNARGETERSTTAIGAQLTVIANDEVNFAIVNVHITRKQGSRRKPAAEIWRTKVAPVLDSPFYLTTSKDPAATGDNRYVENDATLGTPAFTYVDNFTDAVLETKEQSPENGGVLVHLAPPAATILTASDTRLFLAGVAGEPNRVWYSLLRQENEIAAFHGALAIALPTVTGPITALAIQNETLVAFTASAIYAIPGDGFDNLGGGSNYGPPRLLSSDVGALSHDSVALTPGGLVFFSRKGWYRLGTGWNLEYIGAPVESFNTDSGGFVASQVVESQHQVRFLSGSRMLVWDYLVNQWSEWTETSGRDLAVWRSSPMLLDTAVKKEQTTFTSVTYDMDVETAWIKLSGLQGFGRVRWIEILGEFKVNHQQQIRVARDYLTTYFDDRTIGVTGFTAGAGEQVRHGPSQQRLEAIKVRVTIKNLTGGTPAFDAVALTGIGLEVGLKRGLYRRLPAAQKQ